jgi:glutathione S-transferase
MQTDITLGYWKIRGLGFHVRVVLEYLGLSYKIKDYVQGDAPEFSVKEWHDDKFSLGFAFPNLPYIIDGDVKLSETLAIMQYLANKYDRTLLGKTAADFGLV